MKTSNGILGAVFQLLVLNHLPSTNTSFSHISFVVGPISFTVFRAVSYLAFALLRTSRSQSIKLSNKMIFDGLGTLAVNHKTNLPNKASPYRLT